MNVRITQDEIQLDQVEGRLLNTAPPWTLSAGPRAPRAGREMPGHAKTLTLSKSLMFHRHISRISWYTWLQTSPNLYLVLYAVYER